MLTQIRKILVPTNFTPASQNALELAAHMAERHRAEIMLLHVTPQQTIISGGGAQALVSIDPVEDAAANNLLLEELKNNLQKKFPHISVYTQIKPGNFIDALNETVVNENIDLIVMGTQGTQNFKKFILGSYTYEVIANSNCSVLTVPEDYNQYRFHKILFPLRNVSHLKSKLRWSLSLLRKNNAFLNILGLTDYDHLIEFKEVAAQVLKPLSAYNGLYNLQMMLTEDNAEEIIRFAGEHQNDLIVLSNTDEETWKSFMAGNFFKKVINGTNVPLLFVKPFNTEIRDSSAANQYNLALPIPG